MGSRAGVACAVVVAVEGALEVVPTEEVWGAALAVATAAGVGVTALTGAEATGRDAVVPAVAAKFLAAGFFTIVCSCC